jgi:flagella synthesis protein FlgN
MADHNSVIALKLTNQLECLSSLHALLNDELTAIASRRGEGLKELSQQKIPFLTKLNTLDKELKSLITKNDTPSTDVTDLITQVRGQLEICKKQNNVNAHAAHHAQLSVKQLKEILIGAPASMTYSQTGSVVNTENNLVRNLKA